MYLVMSATLQPGIRSSKASFISFTLRVRKRPPSSSWPLSAHLLSPRLLFCLLLPKLDLLALQQLISSERRHSLPNPISKLGGLDILFYLGDLHIRPKNHSKMSHLATSTNYQRFQKVSKGKGVNFKKDKRYKIGRCIVQ